MEEVNGTETEYFVVDTKGLCLLCLHSTENTSVDTNHRAGTPEIPTFTQFHTLSQYLNIDLSEVLPYFGEETGQTARDSDLLVSLCQNCSDVTGKFSGLYQELQALQMQLDAVVKDIHDLVNVSEKNPKLVREYRRRLASAGSVSGQHSEEVNGLANLVQILRQETLQKSASHIFQSPHRVQLNKRKLSDEDDDDDTDEGMVKRKILCDAASEDDEEEEDATTGGVLNQQRPGHSNGLVIQRSTVVKVENHIDPEVEWIVEDDGEDEEGEGEMYADADTEDYSSSDVVGAEEDSSSNLESVELDNNGTPGKSKRGGKQPPRTCWFMVKLPQDHPSTFGKKKRSEYFYCKLCNKSVTNKYRHERIHTKEKIYTCQFCNIREFTDSANLKHHIDLQHFEYYFIQFMKPTMTQERFRELVETMLNDIKKLSDEDHKCAYCDKSWSHKNYSNIGFRGHIFKYHFQELTVKLDEYITMEELEIM